MTAPPDPLEPLRRAWTIALNPGANRLLCYAISHGSLALADALEISAAGTSRSSAENLAKRLEEADLLERATERPVTYAPTAIGEVVAAFIDRHAWGKQTPARPTLVILDDEQRATIEQAGFEFYGVLRHAAIEISELRRGP